MMTAPMTDTTAQAAPGSNLPEFSVSEISAALKRVVEGEFGHVRVRGEIAGFKRAASGHLYMRLKDENAVLDAVCWKGVAGALSVRPEDGMEVIATGRLTTYQGRSTYQIVIEAMELAGEGALLKLLEERRKKLAAEGLFAEERKRPLPYLPVVIGVVTSPTGAVIRDILHRLRERFPRHVMVWPVLVQGEGAADQVSRAIEGFNRLAPGGTPPRPDVLIVARGGGSLEDLWAFNEEVVVRAAAASGIPLISAVGHETDTTLIDYASDRRAPTPTAAAEIAVPVRAELVAQVLDKTQRLVGSMSRLLEDRRIRVEGLARGLPRPDQLLDAARQTLDDRSERLAFAMKALVRGKTDDLARTASGLRKRALEQLVERGRERVAELEGRLVHGGRRAVRDAASRLEAQAKLLEALSYRGVLSRGYAVVRDEAGTPVTAAAGATPGSGVAIEFHDGEVGARIEGEAPARPAPKPKKTGAKKSKATDPDQGSLL